MLRTTLLLLVIACKKNSGDCEATRDQFLAHANERIVKALAMTKDSEKPAIQAQADQEVANTRAKFVDYCERTPEFRFDCFESIAKEGSTDCKAFMKDFMHEVLR